MIILAYVFRFMLHVLITCLDVVFIKTCVDTCTTNEPHLILVYMFRCKLNMCIWPNDHIGLCLSFYASCFDYMFRCSFIKTCVATCTTDEPHLIFVCLCLIAHLYPLDVLV